MTYAFNRDCMEAMPEFPDGFFDLAVVDTPYGIGETGSTNKTRSKLAKSKDYGNKSWDNEPPPPEYFTELFRVSKNQIVFGANHFISRMPFDSPCWIVWDKVNGQNDFADCELAWTSFPSAVRMVRFMWHGFMQGGGFDGKMNARKSENEKRIHPTQKPVPLYRWIFDKYAAPGQKILDTHLGSGSSRIAAHSFGLDFWGYELDPEYFADQEKRFNQYASQITLQL